MRKLLALLLAALLLAPPLAKAQDATVIIPWAASAGCTGYTGPGDVTTFTAWYGLRAYSCAIVQTGTQTLVNLSRSSDSHTCDIIVSGTGGLGNTANCSTGGDNGTAVATWCNATTCTVATIYDQTGGGRNLVQATVADQPTLTLSCIGSLPCMQGTGAAVLLASGSNFTPSSATASFSLVGMRTTSTANTQTAIRENGGNNRFLWGGVTSKVALTGGSSGTFNVTATDITTHAFNVVLSGASSVVNVDGTETTGTATGNTTAGLIQLFGGTATIREEEAGFIDASAISGTTRTNLCHNQFGYWGTSTSC